MLTAIIGGGTVGDEIHRQVIAGGGRAQIIKGLGPGVPLALPEGTRRVIITAQSRDAASPVVTEDLAFVNAGLVVKVLAAAERHGVEDVCVFSTGSVYRREERPLREDDALNDISPTAYEASKIAAELYARTWAARLRRVVVLRPFMIYGRGLPEARLLARVPAMVRNDREFTLAGGLGMVFNPVHASDVAAFSLFAMDTVGDGYSVFNVGGLERLTLRDVAEVAGRALGKQPVLRDTAASPMWVLGDVSAMTRLGFQPKVSFAEGFTRFCRDSAS